MHKGIRDPGKDIPTFVDRKTTRNDPHGDLNFDDVLKDRLDGEVPIRR